MFVCIVYLNFSDSTYEQYEDLNKALCITLTLDKPAIFDLLIVDIMEKDGTATGMS